MKTIKKNFVMAAAALMVMASSMTAFAAEMTDSASYSYLAGKNAAASRVQVYEEAMKIENEEERAAYLKSFGLNEEAWSEENAANYSWISGQARGSQYADHEESEDTGAYSFRTGRNAFQERHAIYE